MPMRNPFRRQTETAAPTLRERAANLRARFASTTRKPEGACRKRSTVKITFSDRGVTMPARSLFSRAKGVDQAV